MKLQKQTNFFSFFGILPIKFNLQMIFFDGPSRLSIDPSIYIYKNEFLCVYPL